jgi:3-hydroxyacyl-CoA dehydrogenase
VLCGNAFGFIGHRIYDAYRRQCESMLEDGAWPEDVDGALVGVGFAMGPFTMAALSDWILYGACARRRWPCATQASAMWPFLDRLCEQGWLARKTGAGYYDYSDGKPAPASDRKA